MSDWVNFKLGDHIIIGDDDCRIQQDFKVKGLPYAVLVDTDGLIAWMGHPETRNLRDDIIQLLTNQILFGTEEDEEDPEAPKKLEKKNFEMQLAKMDLFFKETEEKKE